VSRCLTLVGRQDFLPKIRGYGSLAWAFAGPVFGWFQGEFGLQIMFQVVFVSICFTSVALFATLPSREAYKQAVAEPGKSVAPVQPYLERLAAVLKKRREVPIFLLGVWLAGIHQGMFFVLGFVFVEAELGANGLEIGLYVFVTAVLELPFFMRAKKIAAWLGGPTPTLFALNFVGAVRFGVGYMFAQSIWQLLCFEWLNSLMFALYFTEQSDFAEGFHADGLQATLFGTVGFVYAGGLMTASAASGLLADTIGMRSTFLCAGLLFAFAGLLYHLVLGFSFKGERHLV